MHKKTIGIAVVGSGRIGTLRAVMASRHPAVDFLAVSDLEPAKAEKLATQCGANCWSGNNLEIMSRPEVDAVVVSTIELEHVGPVEQALEMGKMVLVEKPLALTLADADRLVAAAARYADRGASLHVGFSRRFKKRYMIAREQLRHGRLGELTGAVVRLFNTRSQALQSLTRLPENSPTSGLTYYIDLMGWFFEANPIVEVVARGKRGVLLNSGHNTTDLAHAILTCADGAVIAMSVSYALPKGFPVLGHAARVELLGAEGVMLLDDDHTDQLFYSEHAVGHVYIPGHEVNMAFLGSGTPGDWAMDEFWGPVATETRAWIDHLTAGTPALHSTSPQARQTLAVTLAMEESLRTGVPAKVNVAPA
jgi:predicted dehydrogenase